VFVDYNTNQKKVTTEMTHRITKGKVVPVLNEVLCHEDLSIA
jgi:hypothetical protein